MPNWRLLLDRAIDGLQKLEAKGQPAPHWILGGGTALMVHTGHRLSKDIDAFITDPQYITILSPRLGGEGVWNCSAYEEQANHLRLVYPEGEIDFIVAAPVTELAATKKSIDPDESDPQGKIAFVEIEHPAEIALKKLTYRASMLKVRDIFDIAVVDNIEGDALRENLRRVTRLKPQITARLASISEDFCREELAELDISNRWLAVAETCLQRVRQMIGNMKDA